MPKSQLQNKEAAYNFMISLESHLNDILPNPENIRSEVSKICSKPDAQKTPQEKLDGKEENIFFYHFALPEIFAHMLTVDGMDASKARRSLRCEYYKKFPHLSFGNTQRKQGHPFAKEYPFEKPQPAALPRSSLRMWRGIHGSWVLTRKGLSNGSRRCAQT